jgi:hypothetical protein
MTAPAFLIVGSFWIRQSGQSGSEFRIQKWAFLLAGE